MSSTQGMVLLENKVSPFNESEIKRNLTADGAVWIEVKNRQKYSSYDGSHLDEESAIRFSKYLGQEIRKKL